jgi:Cof subfamily protein (haloacid dehalogenase superfamily)
VTVFVSDLDGTLLDRRGRLSDRSRAGVLSLLERGVPFTVASARSVVSMQGALGPLPLRLPVVCFNGGFLSDFATGRHLVVHSLPGDAARRAFELAAGQGLRMLVSTHTPVGDRMYVPVRHNDGVGMYVSERRAAGDPRLRLVADPAVGLDEQVTCLTVIDRRAAVEAVAAEIRVALGDSVRPHLWDDQYTVGWTWLTLHAAAAEKGRGVGDVLERHGLQDRRLVVFGDQHNDLPMFERADYAVATDNAVPEVKAAADEVIGPHHTDSVVAWLLHHAG